jgi:hypothetical protein
VVPAYDPSYRRLGNSWDRAAQTSPSTVRSVNLDHSFAWPSITLYRKPLDLVETPQEAQGHVANTSEGKDVCITEVEVLNVWNSRVAGAGRSSSSWGPSRSGTSQVLTDARGASCAAGVQLTLATRSGLREHSSTAPNAS